MLESVEAVLKLIGSYPAWAKIGMLSGIALTVGIAVLANRNIGDANADNDVSDKDIFLRVEEIKLFPNNGLDRVQLIIFVNNQEFLHPSIGGVEWMIPGPSMSHKIIPLPKADRYEVRFELNVENGSPSRGYPTVLDSDKSRRMSSQLVTQALKLPFSEEYELYPTANQTRSPQIEATVSYKIYEE